MRKATKLKFVSSLVTAAMFFSSIPFTILAEDIGEVSDPSDVAEVTLPDIQVEEPSEQVDIEEPTEPVDDNIDQIPQDDAHPDEVVADGDDKVPVTEPSEVSDPVEITEPTESSEVSDPVEVTEPTEPSEVTEPIEVTEPTEPSEVTEPVEVIEPTEPSEVTDPTEVIEPTEPSEVTDPTEVTEPSEIGEPVEINDNEVDNATRVAKAISLEDFIEISSVLSGNRLVIKSSKDIEGLFNELESFAGVYFDGTYVISISDKEYESAVSIIEKAKLSYAEDGIISLCADDIDDTEANESPDKSVAANSVRVAIIDTGSTKADAIYSVLPEDSGRDFNGHGTKMVSFVESASSGAAYTMSIKAIGDNGKGQLIDVYNAVQLAKDLDADVILMSISMKDSGDYAAFKSLVSSLASVGAKVIASAGNNNQDASNYIPANIKGVVPVGALNEDLTKQENSNYGSSVKNWVIANSTSEAAAKYVGYYLADAKENIFDGYLTNSSEDQITVDPDSEDNDPDEFIVTGTYDVSASFTYYTNLATAIDNSSAREVAAKGIVDAITGELSKVNPTVTYNSANQTITVKVKVDVSGGKNYYSTIYSLRNKSNAISRYLFKSSGDYSSSNQVTYVNLASSINNTLENKLGSEFIVIRDGNGIIRTAVKNFKTDSGLKLNAWSRLGNTTPDSESVSGITLRHYCTEPGHTVGSSGGSWSLLSLSKANTWYGVGDWDGYIRLAKILYDNNSASHSKQNQYYIWSLVKANNPNGVWSALGLKSGTGTISDGNKNSISAPSVPTYTAKTATLPEMAFAFTGTGLEGNKVTLNGGTVTLTPQALPAGVAFNTTNFKVTVTNKAGANVAATITGGKLQITGTGTASITVTTNGQGVPSLSEETYGLYQRPNGSQTRLAGYYSVTNYMQPLYANLSTETLPELTLRKLSTNAGITSSGSTYSLSGVKYTLYSDEACTSPIHTFKFTETKNSTTHEAISDTYKGLEWGESYYLKEIKAGKNFTLDETVYRITFRQNTDLSSDTWAPVYNTTSGTLTVHGQSINVSSGFVGNTQRTTSGVNVCMVVGRMKVGGQQTVNYAPYFSKNTTGAVGTRGLYVNAANNNSFEVKLADYPNRSLKLVKDLANKDLYEDLLENNSLYSLDGTRYGVYSDADCTQTIGSSLTIKKTADGDYYFDEIDLSPYILNKTSVDLYIKELAAGDGMLLDSKIHRVHVNFPTASNPTVNPPNITNGGSVEIDGDMIVVTVEDTPATVKNLISILKREKGTTTPVVGASFELLYCDTLNKEDVISSSNVINEDRLSHVSTLKTDANGRITWSSTADLVLPIGFYLVRETASPSKYVLCEDDIWFIVRRDNAGSKGVFVQGSGYGVIHSSRTDDGTAAIGDVYNSTDINNNVPQTTVMVNSTVDETTSIHVALTKAPKAGTNIIVNNNPCYSLEGTTYRLYGSFANAQGNTNALNTFRISSNGSLVTADTEYEFVPTSGTTVFFVKETAVGKNYLPDQKIYRVIINSDAHTYTYGVTANGTTITSYLAQNKAYSTADNKVTLAFTDEPGYDPLSVKFYKRNASGEAVSTDRLNSAQFRMTYYQDTDTGAGSITLSNPVNAATVTFTAGEVVDRENGYDLDFLANTKSNSYWQQVLAASNGSREFPLGTYVFEEIVAPSGFRVAPEIIRQVLYAPDTQPWQAYVKDGVLHTMATDGSTTDGTSFVHYKSSTVAGVESVEYYIDQAYAGQYSLTKNIVANDVLTDRSGFVFEFLDPSNKVIATGTSRADGVVVWTYANDVTYVKPNSNEKLAGTTGHTTLVGLPIYNAAGTSKLTYHLRERIPTKTVGGYTYTFTTPDGWTKQGNYFVSNTNIQLPDNGTYSHNAANNPVYGTMRINKTEDAGNGDKTFTFDVFYRGNGASAANVGDTTVAPFATVTITTHDGAGSATVNNMPEGWYETIERPVTGYASSWEGDTTEKGALSKIDSQNSTIARPTATVNAVNKISIDLIVDKLDSWNSRKIETTGEYPENAHFEFTLYKDLNENGILDEDEVATGKAVIDEDNDGELIFRNLSKGYYILVETVTVPGYHLMRDEDRVAFAVTDSNNVNINVKDTPYCAPLRITKKDNDTGEPLSGAEFAVYYDKNGNGKVDGETDTIAQVWLDANKNGVIDPEEGVVDCVITETEPGIYESNGSFHFNDGEEFGVQYIVVEVKAPDNYFFVDEDGNVTDKNYTSVFTVEPKDTTAADFEIAPIEKEVFNQTGTVIVRKTNQKGDPLTGAEFTVYEDEECTVIKGILTEDTATNTYSYKGLGLGTWYLKETRSPDDFEIDPRVYPFEVTLDEVHPVVSNILAHKYEQDGKFVDFEIHTTAKDEAIDPGYQPLAHYGPDVEITDDVYFDGLIVGQEYSIEGALHYVKDFKDVNGVEHKAGDLFLDAEGNPYKASIKFVAGNETEGVTFTIADDGQTIEGYATLKFVVDTTSLAYYKEPVVAFEELYREPEHTRVGVHSDINDIAQTKFVPNIMTTLCEVDLTDKHISELQEVTLTDTIKFENLEYGKTYTAKGVLMVAETGEPLLDKDGNPVESESVTFTVDDKIAKSVKNYKISDDKTVTLASGEVSVSFVIDATLYPNVVTTAFEYVTAKGTDDKDVVIAQHTEINDVEQMVIIPDIHTTFEDGVDGAKIASYGEKTPLVDTVFFNNLIQGQEYTVNGILHYDNGEEVLDADGNPYKSSVTFIAGESGEAVITDSRTIGVPVENGGTGVRALVSGYVRMLFIVDTTVLQGKTIVAFEDLETTQRKVASHADLKDNAQTIWVPEIRTQFLDKETDEHIVSRSDKAILIDHISFKNLDYSKTYTIKGQLINKKTGEVVAFAEKEYKPAEDSEINESDIKEYVLNDKGDMVKIVSGMTTLEFTCDTTALEGTDVVAFEKLFIGDTEKARHEDIDDVDQTVKVPQIRTTLTDKATGTHAVSYGEKIKLVDTVAYENLIPGKKYTMTGTLYNKETGEELKDADGNAYIAKKTFTADAAEGTVDIVFTINSTLLKGATIVAFEECRYEGITIAIHADIEDEGQTVRVPEASTTATIGNDGKKEITLRADEDKTVDIYDTIHYKNLIPGKKYRAETTLMKSTGEPLTKNGQSITAYTDFVPEKADGDVVIKIAVSSKDLIAAGVPIVIFEKVWDIAEDSEVKDGTQKKDTLVAVHEDLEDEDQTVRVKVTEIPATGETMPAYAKYGISAILSLTIGAFVYHFLKKKEEEDEEMC